MIEKNNTHQRSDLFNSTSNAMNNHLDYPNDSGNKYKPSGISLPSFQNSLAGSTPYLFDSQNNPLRPTASSSPIRLQIPQAAPVENLFPREFSIDEVNLNRWSSHEFSSSYSDTELTNGHRKSTCPLITPPNGEQVTLPHHRDKSTEHTSALSQINECHSLSESELMTIRETQRTEISDSILPAMNSLVVSQPVTTNINRTHNPSAAQPISLPIQPDACENVNQVQNSASPVVNGNGTRRAIRNNANESIINNRYRRNGHLSTPTRTKLYRCKQCDFTCRIKEDFWDHQRIHIRPDKLLECPRCSFITEYKHHLEYHLRNHIGSKPFNCIRCHYKCVNLSMLRSHMKSHLRPSQYRCNNCAYVSRTFSGLQIHTDRANHQPASEAVTLAIQRNQLRRALQPQNIRLANNTVGVANSSDNSGVINLSTLNCEEYGQLPASPAMNQTDDHTNICNSISLTAENNAISSINPQSEVTSCKPERADSHLSNQVNHNDQCYSNDSTVQQDHLLHTNTDDLKPSLYSVKPEKPTDNAGEPSCQSNDYLCDFYNESYTDLQIPSKENDQPADKVNNSFNLTANKDDPLTLMEIESVKANMNAHLRCGVCDYLAPSRHAMNNHLLYHASFQEPYTEPTASTSNALTSSPGQPPPSQTSMNENRLRHEGGQRLTTRRSIELTDDHRYSIDEHHLTDKLSNADNYLVCTDLKPKRRRKGRVQRIISSNFSSDVPVKRIPNPLDLRTTSSSNTEDIFHQQHHQNSTGSKPVDIESLPVEDCDHNDSVDETWLPTDIGESLQLNNEEEYKCHRSAKDSSTIRSSRSSPHCFGRLFECELCGILFRNFAMYCTHKMFHSPNEPFRCNQCGQLYGERVEFFVHVAQDAHELK